MVFGGLMLTKTIAPALLTGHLRTRPLRKSLMVRGKRL